MTPSFWGTTTHHSSKSLAKRARHSAVASERLAGRGARYPIYGNNALEPFRQVGVYTGRVLKGAKPAHLPVVQSSKFVFAINLQTARALGIEVPSGLLSIADEVIE
jgi:putative ABC transport system substrate-binding protein